MTGRLRPPNAADVAARHLVLVEPLREEPAGPARRPGLPTRLHSPSQIPEVSGALVALDPYRPRLGDERRVQLELS